MSACMYLHVYVMSVVWRAVVWNGSAALTCTFYERENCLPGVDMEPYFDRTLLQPLPQLHQEHVQIHQHGCLGGMHGCE